MTLLNLLTALIISSKIRFSAIFSASPFPDQFVNFFISPVSFHKLYHLKATVSDFNVKKTESSVPNGLLHALRRRVRVAVIVVIA